MAGFREWMAGSGRGARATVAGLLALTGLSLVPADAQAWRGQWRGVFSAADAAKGAAVSPKHVVCKFQDRAIVWIGQVDGDKCRYADADGKPQSRKIPKGGGGFSVIEPSMGYEGFAHAGRLAVEADGIWASKGIVAIKSHGLTRALCVADELPGGAAAQGTLGWFDFPVAETPVCRTFKGTSPKFRLVETSPADAHIALARQWKRAAQTDVDLKGVFAVGEGASAVRFCRARTAKEKRYLLPGVLRGDGAERFCLHVASVDAAGQATLARATDPDTYQVLHDPILPNERYSFGGLRDAEHPLPPVGLTNGRLKAGVLGIKPAYLCRDVATGGFGVVAEERCHVIEGEAARLAPEFDVLGVFVKAR